MMRELENGWAQLASEVDGTGLAPAATLRRAADKRARRRIAVVTSAVAVALVATGVGAFGRPGPPPPGPITPPSPTATQAPTPSPTPSAAAPPTTPPASPKGSAPPVVTSVPDRAFLVMPQDMRRDMRVESVPPGQQVPALCDNPLGADPTMTVREARKTWYGDPADPIVTTIRGSVAQTISVYEPGGAAAAMRRLRSELDSCRSRSDANADVTFTTQGPPSHGDEGVYLVETFQTTKENYRPPRWAEHVTVVRVGEVITVLRVTVFEGGFPDRADVDLFVRLAVDAIDDWR
jgi:hypothetical protein